MALVQLSSIVTSIKGSVGGSTYSSTRSGTAVKARLTGRKSVSSKQLAALNTNKASLPTWANMGYGPRQNWNDYGSIYTFTDRFGRTKSMTGLNWFVMINYNRLFLGQTVTTSPPTYEVPSSLPVFYVVMSTTTMYVQWSTLVDDTTTDIMVFASPPSRSQAQYNRGKYLLLGRITADYTDNFDITALWETATGLSYSAVVGAGFCNINVLIVPVSKTSYISGLGQTATSQVPRSGIGWMAIGSTFIVT
jgi:hypothetical protein